MNFLVREFKERYFNKILNEINKDVNSYLFKSNNEGLLVNNYVSSKFIDFLQSQGFEGDDLINVYSHNIDLLYMSLVLDLKKIGYNVGTTLSLSNGSKQILVFIYKSKAKSVIGTIVSNVPFIKSIVKNIA